MNFDILKGLLIILVVIDHNDFSRSIFPDLLNGFTFHVVGFMAIPFFKPAIPWGRDVWHYALRLYYPYFLVVSAMSALLILVADIPIMTHIKHWIIALYNGNPDSLKAATHMALLWFLPSFIVVIVVRSMIERAPASGRILLCVLAIGHAFIGAVPTEWHQRLPLGLLPALYTVPLSVAIVACHRLAFAKMDRLIAIVIAFIIFAVVKYLQIRANLYAEIGFGVLADYSNPYALLLNDMEAVFGVLLLLQVSRFDFSALVRNCGRYSMQIYLSHAFISLALFLILKNLALPVEVAFVLSVTATVIASLHVSRMMMSRSFLASLVFPRSLGDLVQPFKRKSVEN